MQEGPWGESGQAAARKADSPARRPCPEHGSAPAGNLPVGADPCLSHSAAAHRQSQSAASAAFHVADGRMTAAAFAGSGW